MAVQACSEVTYPFIFQEWSIDEADPACVIWLNLNYDF